MWAPCGWAETLHTLSTWSILGFFMLNLRLQIQGSWIKQVMWREMTENSACHFAHFSLLPNINWKMLPSHFEIHVPIFPSMVIKFHLQTNSVQKFNSCVHDGTLWIATVTFPSDRTSKLLQEISNKKNLKLLPFLIHVSTFHWVPFFNKCHYSVLCASIAKVKFWTLTQK